MESAIVWLVDSHSILRSGLRAQLEGKGFQVGAECAGIDEALRQPAKNPSPNVIIADFGYGPPSIAKLKAAHPQAKLVVLAESAELGHLAEVFSLGCDGYLLKSISSSALLESLKLVLLGEKVFPSVLTNFLGVLHSNINAGHSDRLRVGDVALSQRELDIIRSVADGHTNKSIAKELAITEATVKVHIKTVLRKLGAANRTQVAIWAIQHGLTNSFNLHRQRMKSIQ